MPGLDKMNAPAGALLIQGFADGGFRIAGAVHRGAVLVTPERVTAWAPRDPQALTAADFAPLAEAAPPVELLLIGTGAQGRLPDMALIGALGELGLAADLMATRAAARTYNLLVAEGRRVAAALLPG